MDIVKEPALLRLPPRYKLESRDLKNIGSDRARVDAFGRLIQKPFLAGYRLPYFSFYVVAEFKQWRSSNWPKRMKWRPRQSFYHHQLARDGKWQPPGRDKRALPVSFGNMPDGNG